VRGHIEGDTRVEVVTRYELRTCDPGLRVRTEVYNGGRTVWAQYLSDGFFWGDRGLTPFLPIRGHGFNPPPFELTNLDRSFREVPWMAAQSHVQPGQNSSYAVVSCEQPTLQALQSATLSAVGRRRAV